MKIAVFGKPGGGKSTLSEKIAAAAGLPLYQLDLIQWEKGGAEVATEVWASRHAQILARQRWVLDGFGTPGTFEAMLQAADVLVYVERSPAIHYWWVTKRFLKSPFSRPIGWPENSPMLQSTMEGYRVLRLSPTFWTAALKAKLLATRPGKRVYVVSRRSDEVSLLTELAQRATTR